MAEVQTPPETDRPRREALLTSSAAGAQLREALGVYLGVGTVLIVICVFFGVTATGFFTYSNLQNILQTNAALLIVATGLTFSMLAGGFDLSVGGVLALAGIVFAKLLTAGVPMAPAIAIVVIGGILFGAFVNGFLIAVLELNFFVVVLGTNAATLSLALELSGGQTILLDNNHSLVSLGNGTVGTIPTPVIIAFVLLILAICTLRYTGLGRMVYAVGGNAEASRIAGINVAMTKMSTYAISAGMASIAGIIETARLAGASPTTDSNIALNAGAAVLLGGCAFGGGSGTLLGTLLGVMFLGVLQNGLVISSISDNWQGVITGVVLVAAVGLDRFRRARIARSVARS